MEGLPFELQDGIFQHLVFLDDVKAVRLLNRNFHDLATPYLFRRVSLTVRTESFNRLNQICNSKLSQHVRTLHYNIWEIALILEREWVQALKRSSGKRADDDGGYIPQYKDYHAYYLGQVLHDEYNLLMQAFRHLPSLRNLEISECEPPLLSSQLKDISRVIEAAATCPHEYIPSAHASSVQGKISRPLTMIMAHGAVTHGALESFSLHGFRWHWLDMRDVRMWHEKGLLHEACGRLRRLRIEVPDSGPGVNLECLDADADADVPDPVAAEDVWRGLIGLAEGLEKVEVLVGDDLNNR